MRTHEIAQHIDFVSILTRNDLSKSALDVLSLAIDQGDLDNVLQQDGNLDEYSRTGMIGLLELRARNLAAQRRQFHGFGEALAAVRRLEDTERVSWMAVSMPSHLLIILIKVSDYAVLGCMSLKRIGKEHPVVPSNWDGSELS